MVIQDVDSDEDDGVQPSPSPSSPPAGGGEEEETLEDRLAANKLRRQEARAAAAARAALAAEPLARRSGPAKGAAAKAAGGPAKVTPAAFSASFSRCRKNGTKLFDFMQVGRCFSVLQCKIVWGVEKSCFVVECCEPLPTRACCASRGVVYTFSIV